MTVLMHPASPRPHSFFLLSLSSKICPEQIYQRFCWTPSERSLSFIKQRLQRFSRERLASVSFLTCEWHLPVFKYGFVRLCLQSGCKKKKEKKTEKNPAVRTWNQRDWSSFSFALEIGSRGKARIREIKLDLKFLWALRMQDQDKHFVLNS